MTLVVLVVLLWLLGFACLDLGSLCVLAGCMGVVLLTVVACAVLDERASGRRDSSP